MVERGGERMVQFEGSDGGRASGMDRCLNWRYLGRYAGCMYLLGPGANQTTARCDKRGPDVGAI